MGEGEGGEVVAEVVVSFIPICFWSFWLMPRSVVKEN